MPWTVYPSKTFGTGNDLMAVNISTVDDPTAILTYGDVYNVFDCLYDYTRIWPDGGGVGGASFVITKLASMICTAEGSFGPP